MQFVSNAPKKKNFVYIMISLIVVVGITSACTLPTQAPPPQVGAIGQIAKAQTSAREGVLLVRQYIADKESWEYTEARKLYTEAQAEFNGWIEQLKADITFGTAPDTAKYDATLASARQKTEDFLKLVQQIQQTHTDTGSANSSNQECESLEREDTAVLLVSLTSIVAPIVVEAAFNYWEASQKAETQEQEKNINYLNTLLWDSFDNIK
ncbi:MAG: hypothetical protein R3E79_62325 [Caldilineaceae bacterium]